MLDMGSFYMNVNTGTVQSGEDWLIDQKQCGFPITDLDKLEEVVWCEDSLQWCDA